MRAGVKSAGCLLLCVLAFTGCGQAKVPDHISETSIVINEKGEVTSYLVGIFDKGYYDISELTSMAVEEAASYNTEHQQDGAAPVTVEKVEYVQESEDSQGGAGNAIVVQERYSSAGVYSDYSGQQFFFGTVAEALAAGYDCDFIFTGVRDAVLLSGEQLLQKKEQHILISDTAAVYYCPYKVTHVSMGAEWRKDGSVDALGAEGTIAILMK